jgi:hypothetical protein
MIASSRIEGTHLAGNLLRDPSERDLFVYLPPGYEDSDRRYTTAYLLQAFGSSAARLVQPETDRQRWVPPIEDVLDPVFGRMGVAPMVVVIPDGWTSYGCGQWVDHRFAATSRSTCFTTSSVTWTRSTGRSRTLEAGVSSATPREVSGPGTWLLATQRCSGRWQHLA